MEENKKNFKLSSGELCLLIIEVLGFIGFLNIVSFISDLSDNFFISEVLPYLLWIIFICINIRMMKWLVELEENKNGKE